MKKRIGSLIFVIMFFGCIVIFFKDKIITQAPDHTTVIDNNTTVTDNDRTRPHRVEKETLSQDGLGHSSSEYRGIISLSQLKSENELIKEYAYNIEDDNEYSYRISNSYISRRLENAYLAKRTPDIKKSEENRFKKHIAEDGTFVDTFYYLYFDVEVINTGDKVFRFLSSFLMFTTIYDNICEMKAPRFDGDVRGLTLYPNYIIETSEKKLVTGMGETVPEFKPGEKINLKYCFIVTEDVIDDIYIYTSGGKNAKDTIEDNTVNYVKINPKKIEE